MLSGALVGAMAAVAAALAHAEGDEGYTFESLHPEFLRTQTPAYAQYVPSVSPAANNRANNDFIEEFDSPGGKRVTVVGRELESGDER
jgi:hypothetical protein